MDANAINELKNGLSAAYINGSLAANLVYKPAFISNNPEEGKKVISSVEDELLRCEEFQISVAFITLGGVTPLLQTLKELEKKGVKGQILTTNYLDFSEPRALGIRRYERNYKNTYKQTDLVLYQKYTYEDVCRLLNWEQNEVPLNIGGYKFDKKTKTFPVFINYDKSENISDTTKYEDHFIPGSRDRLIAISKSGRTLKSEDVQNFLKAKERGIQVELFVRKNKDDKISKEFYYLGHMTASGNTKEFTMVNTEKTAVEIEWILDVPVREDIYEYIVNS